MNRTPMSRFMSLLACCLLASPPLGWGNDQTVKAIPIGSADYARKIPVYCQIEPLHRYVVTSEYGAIIDSLAEEGRVVEKGEVVAQQQTFYLQQEIRTLKDNVELADISIDFFDKELERRRVLRTKNSASQVDVDELQYRIDQERISRSKLLRELKTLERRLSKLVHIAPYDAQVHTVDAQHGEFVDDGSSIMTLLPLDRKRFRCSLPLSEYKYSTQSSGYSFYHGDTQLKNYHMSEVLDPDVKLITIYFNIDGDSARSELFFDRTKIEMVFKRNNVYHVPFDSIVVDRDEQFVWVVDNQSIAHRKTIEVLDSSSEQPIVSGDICADDKIIVEGQARISEGQLVTYLD